MLLSKARGHKVLSSLTMKFVLHHRQGVLLFVMSQATSDTYAFEVKEDWTPHPGSAGKNQWAVKKGDIGWVKGTSGNNDGWAQIKLLDSTRSLVKRGSDESAWIPDKIIIRGKRSGNILTTLKASSFKKPLPQLGSGTNLSRALEALLKRLCTERNVLSEKGASLGDLDRIGKNLESIKSSILGAIPVQSRSTFGQGNIGFESLWNNLPPVSTTRNNRAGIYVILYRNVERDANALKSKTHHRLAARLTTQLGVGPRLTNSPYLPISQTQHHILGFHLKVAEHCFVSLLDSWNPRVLTRPDSIIDYANGGRDVQTALAFSDLARDTFRQLGSWPITTPVQGCNWKTPIAEGSYYDRTPWTSTYIPDTAEFIPQGSKEGSPTRMRVFYRQPTKVQGSLDINSLFITMFGASAFQEFGGMLVTLPQNVGIQKGMFVQLVCEVMLDGSSHSHPWARLPDIGAFSGYRLLNSLGIRVVFQQGDKKWVSCPVQITQFFESMENNQATTRYNGLPQKNFLTREYLKASILLDALMHVHYDPDKLPKWKWDTKSLTIKNIHYNHLDQELHVSDMPTWFLDIPIMQTMRQNYERLQLQYPGIAIGEKRPGVFSTFGESYKGGGTKRDRCDVCYIHKHHLRGNDLVRLEKSALTDAKPCKPIQHEGMTTCWRCLLLKRPCTWTKASEILSKGWQSLAVLPEKPYVLTEVPDPVRTSYFTGPAAQEEDVEAEDDAAGDTEET
ncbi:hypothetical protein VTL71DRAFT_8439 [Oculimacula yallundae]|uniref:Uncharacterized protein n=1 Tax=Oculimacula yallundae TaxID=86028 RepID=A0ABR4CXQ6_9HELO